MTYDLFLLVLRVATGLIVAAHGAQKLFGWWGGPGYAGFRGGMGYMGLKPAGFWAAMGVAGELGGGLLLALGFLQPLGAVGVVAAMLTAIFLVHFPKFFSTNNGSEFPLILLINALVLGFTGAGAYSLDAVLGIALPPTTFLYSLGLAVAGVIVALVTRTPPAPAPTEATANK